MNPIRKLWANLFGSKKTYSDVILLGDKPIRRQVKDVKVGEIIWVEWYRINKFIGQLKCLSNDPETKKILLEVKWSKLNGVENVKEKVIFDYNGVELINFHLLNSASNNKEDSSEIETDIVNLQKKLNEALEKEEYELADELQKKIDKLLKK